MRGTRWLLLVAIVAIVGGIAIKYRAQKRVLQQQSPAKPAALPPELNSSADEWHWEQSENKQPFRKTVEITAKNFRQVKESSLVQLEHVELRLYHKHDDAFDLVKSAAATFNSSDRQLYSEGQVEITLGVPKDQGPNNRLVSIKSSGVKFDSTNGRAETDRPTTFTFANGDGKSLGAIYDPTQHQVEMKSEVEIHWKAPTPRGKPLKIEAANLNYYEDRSEIWLRPWGRVTRENSVIEGEDCVVHLKDQVLNKIEARRAHGTDAYPKRKLEYQAEQLWVDFDDDGEVTRVIGETAAKLVSDAEASHTTVTANRVEMEFETVESDSVLTKVTTRGQSEVESKPKPLPGRTLSETHVLRSDVLEMKMRKGGEEIERVDTRSPGVLEFFPNAPVQRRRTLNGNRMEIVYGAGNQIETFHATDVKTRTEPTADERKRNRALAFTTSKELLARFEPDSNRLATMEQWGDFTYDEGERRARSVRATLDSAQNVIHLENAARVWDAAGATSGDRIHMDQRTGDFTATGNVNSSRMPDKQQKKSSEMLSGDQPLQAQAQKMDSTNHNRVIHYEGKVTMWQGTNRIQGDVVDVNRETRSLVAKGNVVSNLWEQPKDNDPKTNSNNQKKKAASSPVLTVVRAPHLVYTEADRLAHYSGGVHLIRGGLDVKSQELRAWLAESGADSSLDHAFADGKVVIVQTAPQRTRTGIGEHGEYYTSDQRIILRGGEPQLLDSKEGRAQGDELTYFANDDRLLINGLPGRPARSVIRKK